MLTDVLWSSDQTCYHLGCDILAGFQSHSRYGLRRFPEVCDNAIPIPFVRLIRRRADQSDLFIILARSGTTF